MNLNNKKYKKTIEEIKTILDNNYSISEIKFILQNIQQQIQEETQYKFFTKKGRTISLG